MNKLYKNSFGVELIIDVGIDVNTATVLELLVKKPDDTTASWACAVSELTKMRYVTQAGDWDQAGTYTVQAKITFPDRVLYGETATFEVLEQYR